MTTKQDIVAKLWSLCHVLRGTTFTVHLVDPRPEWMDDPELPTAVVKHSESWRAFMKDAEWSTRVYAAVLTYSHDLDREIVADLVTREAAFLGLIATALFWMARRTIREEMVS